MFTYYAYTVLRTHLYVYVLEYTVPRTQLYVYVLGEHRTETLTVYTFIYNEYTVPRNQLYVYVLGVHCTDNLTLCLCTKSTLYREPNCMFIY